jgi:hypothetical protein
LDRLLEERNKLTSEGDESKRDVGVSRMSDRSEEVVVEMAEGVGDPAVLIELGCDRGRNVLSGVTGIMVEVVFMLRVV